MDDRQFKSAAVMLWALLDDIDTMDDAARGNDKAFRDQVRKLQQKRHLVMSGADFEEAAQEVGFDLSGLFHSAKIGRVGHE